MKRTAAYSRMEVKLRGSVGERQTFLFKSSMTGNKAMISADHTGHTRPHTRPGNELTAVTQHFHITCLTLRERTCVFTADYGQRDRLKLNQAADRLQGHER